MLLLALFCSCQRDNTSAQVRQMYSNKLALELEQMVNLSYKSELYPDSRFSLVCYFDSSECHTCATTKLYTWDKFIRKCEANYSVNFIFIFSPKSDSRKYLLTYLEGKRERKNIYVDTLNIFASKNRFIPASPIYHTFLIDNFDNEVKMVGDPRRSPALEKLFDEIVGDQCYSTCDSACNINISIE